MSQITYAQHGEDLAIKRYFKTQEKGHYVDVGAFDPVKYSNTNMFYLNGWSGINVEPNPEGFQRFVEQRQRDTNINCGISLSQERLTYYKFNHGAVNTFVEEQASIWNKKQGFNIEKTIDIKTISLESVLDSNWNGQDIDFMSIDVEGMDFQVLQSNNWKKYLPEMLIVEENIYQYQNYRDSPIYQFLSTKGYVLWNINAISIFYVLEKKYKRRFNIS